MSNIEILKSQLIAKQREITAKNAEIEEKKSEITNYENDVSDSDYEAYLDEAYGEVDVCGQTFSTGYALRLLDETAFRCGKVDYEDSQREDSDGYKALESELEDLENELEDLECEAGELESDIEDAEEEEEE